MSENAIIFITLSTGFISLILFIRFFPSSAKMENRNSLVYYKLDFIEHKISTLSPVIFGEETKALASQNFQLIFLNDLEWLINEKTTSQSCYFLIAFNEAYEESIQKAMPLLINQRVAIIIFLPILFSDIGKKYRKEKPMKLRNIVFYEEVQNYFLLHPTK